MTTPPTVRIVPSSTLRELGDACTSVRRRSDASAPISGWSLHVEAEHLLLEGQPLALVELDVGDRRAGSSKAVPAVVGGVAEQGHDCPCPRSRRRATVRVDDLLEHGEQALAGVAEGVERRRP